jgi:chromosome segregation ATPase
LKNGGNDAYRQDVYGDLIKVQRIFSKDGGSQYKLKSRDDKIISNKKEELEAIADHYGLQVDNPMTILSQDQAKQFLNTSTNAEKYRFFHRGVQLSQLDQDYKLISIAIKNTEQMLLSKQEALDILKTKVAEAEQKVKMHESQDGLRKQFDEVRGQCVWIQVQSAKEHVDQHESRLATITERIQQAEAARDEASAFYEDADKKMEAATRRIAEQNTEVEKAEEEKKMVQDNIDHNKNEIIKIVGEIRKVHPEIKKSDSKIRDTEDKIANEEVRLAERNGGSSARLKEQIDQANLEIEELKKDIKNLELKHSTEENELRELSHRKKQIRDRIDAKQNDLHNAQNLLNSLSQAGRTFMSVFHQSVHSVLRDIENERRWRDKPIGPLGSYVTLKDPKWMDIVERFFGASLESFVVTNHQDGQLLKEILKRNRCSSQFYVSAPAQFTLDEPSERFKTILRILDISDDAVRRQFIVSNACEQAILIEDLEEANEVMSRRQHGDHIQQCFALNAKHPGMGHRVGGGIGVKSVTPVGRWGRASRMRSQNNNLQIDSTNRQIQELQQEIHQLNQQLQEIDHKMSQFNRSMQSFNSRKRNMVMEVTRRQDRIDDWNSKIEVMAADGQLGVLQQTLKVTTLPCPLLYHLLISSL